VVEQSFIEKFDFSKRIPTREELIVLMKAWGLNRNIIEHSRVVMEISAQIIDKILKSNPNADINVEIIKTGALIHDIGRVETHGLEHGYIGGKLLRMVNMDERIVRCAMNHVLGGLTLDDINELFSPDLKKEITKPLIPKSYEEKIVCLADKHAIGTRKVTLEKRFTRWFKKYGRTQFLITARYRVLKIERDIMALL